MRQILCIGIAAMIGLGGEVSAESPASQPAFLTPAGSVPLPGVEGRMDHMTADAKSRRLFVAGLENHSVEIIDLDGRKQLHSITGISEPQGLLFVSAARRLLVCSRGDGTCRSFDADTFEEGPWVDLGRNADNVRLDSKTNTVYVGSGAEPGPGPLSAIDLSALLPVKPGEQAPPLRSKADLLPQRPRQADAKFEVKLAAHPESFMVDPDTNRLFVNVPDTHQIVVVEPTANGLAVSASWPVTAGEKNFPMALDAASGRLFVICRKPACVAVYDTRTGQMRSLMPCVGDCDDVYYDAEQRRLYVIGGEGFVDVFNAEPKAEKLILLAHIPTAPKARTGLFIPQMRLLAVAAPHIDNNPATVLLFRVNP